MTDPPGHRLLIIAGCYADAAPAIGLAEALAQDLRAALIGVLAREPAIAAAIGTTAGALVQTAPRLRLASLALTPEGLSAAYAADARAFSSRLSLIAARASLHWEFRTDSGVSTELACAIRQPGDMVVLGYRRLWHAGGPVVALCRDDDLGTQELAASLARRLGRRAMMLPLQTADPLERIEAMSATALILAPELARHPARLRALAEAARCPVLIAPDVG
ncbi:MAG: hypothetical protein JJU15_14700 [Pararhodobacter sp.]|nr:hypothetical protein [Pararhodobacter sp.]